jgi:outer membrane protein TolC
MEYKLLRLYKLLFVLLICGNTMAQMPPDTFIKIKDAVQLAEQHYQLLQARKYEAEAAQKNIALAEYSRKPTIDISYQANIGTANNLTGIFYPSGILPMTGPPSTGNIYKPATGSAASILLNWQAVTFGQRAAQINSSIAEANVSRRQLEQEIFKHKINVISSYLDVLLYFDLLHIQEYNIQRVDTNLKQSRVLAKTGIKPGVDTAFFLSERSKAKMQYLGAKQELENQQWQLAKLIAIDALPVPVDTAFLNKLPSTASGFDSSFTSHPVIQYAQSQVGLSQYKEAYLKKSYLPKINIWSTAFARGTGFEADGNIKTGEGLLLNRYNYGAGAQIIFPIMKYGEVKHQVQQQSFLSKAAEERLEESKSELNTQMHIANTSFQSSVEIVTEAQQQFKSANYAFNAMQLRYNTGLVNLSDLVQAQYNLLQAELDVKKAYWNVWKAKLLEAAVKGDVNIFLKEIDEVQ